KASPERLSILYESAGLAGRMTGEIIDRPNVTRRSFVMRAGKLVVVAGASSLVASPIFSEADPSIASKRPFPADRKFRSVAVEEYMSSVARVIRDPVLRDLF